MPRVSPAPPQEKEKGKRVEPNKTKEPLFRVSQALPGTQVGPSMPPGWTDYDDDKEEYTCGTPLQDSTGVQAVTKRVRGWDDSLINHYDFLGLPRGSGEASVRRRYLELISEYHPASGGEIDEYIALCAAYDAISNDARLVEKQLQGDEESKAPGTIFVSMVCYRDCEGRFTLTDLFSKAKDPAKIFVGVVWQHANPGDGDIFENEVRYHSLDDVPEALHKQIRQIHVHYKDAEGPVYARHLAQRLYQDEEYYLQIDSHTRFVQDWDEKLLRMLNRCPSEKPMLTSYPLGYKLRDEKERNKAAEDMSFAVEEETERVRAEQKDPSVRLLHAKTYEITRRFRWSAASADADLPEDQTPAVICANKFQRNGLCSFAPKQLKEAPTEPTRSLFWSGSFSFCRAVAFEECPYDPHLPYLMMGEELVMGARFFTHGWDFFIPTESVLFHLYDRSYRQLAHT